MEQMKSNITTLYRKNAYGIGIWSIWNEGNVIVVSHATTLQGAQVQHHEVVTSGKQSRPLDEQVQFKIKGRISKQLDKGYTPDLEAASAAALNQLGLDVPMLANSFDESKLTNTAHIQRKLNGLRCLATKQNGEIILYSRRGKAFAALKSIREALNDIIHEGETFDGEIYRHKTSLQTIQSWAKREQPSTDLLTYVVYDYMSEDDFEDRYNTLKIRFENFESDRVKLLATKKVNSKIEIFEAFAKARSASFEGLMIRLPNYGYENGKRSKSLLKLKEVFSDEGICKAVHPSEKGNPVITILWQHKTFNATPPGTHRARNDVLLNADKYLGRRITFEYRELTDDGLPFHAVAVNWRED